MSSRAERIVHNASQARDAQPGRINILNHEASGERRPRRKLLTPARSSTQRKLSMYAATFCSPCAHYFPHYTAQATAYATFARSSTHIKQAQRSKVYKTRPRAKGGRGVRYALTTANAHHVSQACMLSPCTRHAPHCTAQAQRAEAAAYATLARSPTRIT